MHPSKHLLVLKTSSRRLQDMSSACLKRNNFTSSERSWRRLPKTSWRRLEDILQDALKTSWKKKNCYAEEVFKTSWKHVLKTSWRHVLKTSWRHILKTSWRHYREKQNTNWGSNKSKCVSNKSIFHKSISDNSKANPKCIN